MSASRGLLVFDRDGVLNEPVATRTGRRPPWHRGELQIIDGAAEAIAALATLGYRIVAATNQPDVPRGDLRLADLTEINQAIQAQIPALERIYVCPHDNSDACECRKPKPGMIFDALRDASADPADSWMIGDRWTDILAGKNAAVQTALVKTGAAFAPTSIGAPPPGLLADIEIVALADLVARLKTRRSDE